MISSVLVIAIGSRMNLLVFVLIFHLFSNLFILFISFSSFFARNFLDFPGCVTICVMSSAYMML